MTDWKQDHPAQKKLAKIFSSVRLLGPPAGENLEMLIAHLFSPEEAEVACVLPFYKPKPIEKIARKLGRGPEEIEPLLEAMSVRRVIFKALGGYALMPIVPGMFEFILMKGEQTEWHRKFAEMLNDLFHTGYLKDYGSRRIPIVRNIPVQSVVEAQSRVLDTDLMSEMIASHSSFGVLNVCQCRQSYRFDGRECVRAAPEDGCLIFGSFTEGLTSDGKGRKVSGAEMRDIVADRWEKNLVFLAANVSPDSPNAICTCCDCCCHYIEAVKLYGAKTSMAPPHFFAEVDDSDCNDCGLCVEVCNTGAHTFEDDQHGFDVDQCIGCGLCVEQCSTEAIRMKENPDYKAPPGDFKKLGLRILPATLLSTLSARFARYSRQ